mgnify:CR=1 FL=1
MANIKVLILYPNPRKMALMYGTIALFSALLKREGVTVELFDTSLYKEQGLLDPEEVAEKYLMYKLASHKYKNIVTTNDIDVYSALSSKTKEFKPDLICVTCVESTFEYGISLLKTISDEKILTIMGGLFATFSPDYTLSYDEIDIVCVGEGEKALVDLVRRLKSGSDYSSTDNLCFKNNGKIIKNKIGCPIPLDELPLGDFEIFNENRIYRAMEGEIYRMAPIETHRGCNNICTFCNSPLQNQIYKNQTGEKYFRAKSLQRIYEEIKYFVDTLKADYMFFWADNFFTFSLEDIEAFCEMYVEFQLPFYCQSYPTTINEGKLKLLKRVGLHKLGVGIEHGNENFRNNIIKRNYSNTQAIRSLSLLKKYEVAFSTNNIIGFPDETPELVMDTVELNRAIDPDTASCSIFTPFRGTPLREYAIKKGYLRDPDLIAPSNLDSSVLDMPQFTKEQIEGKRRAFEYYIRFPRKRWKEISRIEKLTPESERLWEELRQEYVEKYCTENNV